ncbi:redoxin domain-containing protein [bacterium]|nr:redoxin domain-containing protein [bacterium]
MPAALERWTRIGLGLLLLHPLPGAAVAQGPAQGETMQPYTQHVRAVEFPSYADWLNTGHRYVLADFRGHFVLLDFWTYCCINCMHVLPDLARLEKKYPQLTVVGVHSAKFEGERSTRNIREAILRYGIEHPVLNDYRFELWNAYAVHAWPSFVLIDPEGYVIAQASGEGIFDLIDSNLGRLSAEYEKRGVLVKKKMEFNLELGRAPRGVLSFPGKLAVDSAGHRLFVTDSDNNRVLVLDPQGHILQVIGSGVAGRADGPFGQAGFLRPQGLAWDPEKQVLYVADTDNHLLRRVDLKAGSVTTVLGTGVQGGRSGGGVGTSLALNSPWDVLLLDDRLIIAMAGPHQLWSFDPESGKAAPLAGSGWEDIKDGPALEAALAQPSGLSTDGRVIYFTDSETSSVRKLEDGRVSTLVGEGLFEFGDIDGPLGQARLQHAIGLLWHAGKIYVADTYNNKIRVIDPEQRRVSTLIGDGQSGDADGPAGRARLNEPNDIEYLDGRFYITDTNNSLIRVYDPSDSRVSSLELKGLDKLEPEAGTAFDGRVVRLPGRTVRPGALSLDFQVQSGSGLEVNDQAPNTLEVSTSDRGAVSVGPFELSGGHTLSTRVPLNAVSGSAGLELDLTVYYCDKAGGGRCFLDRVRYELPLRVAAGGEAGLRLEHSLPRPED